jgi:hypothetical protein
VDMAGAERLAVDPEVLRLREGVQLNRSLLAFAACLRQLAAGGSAEFVDYGGSLVTKLLHGGGSWRWRGPVAGGLQGICMVSAAAGHMHGVCCNVQRLRVSLTLQTTSVSHQLPCVCGMTCASQAVGA